MSAYVEIIPPTHPSPPDDSTTPIPPHPKTNLQIFERYVGCHPTQRAYLKYAKWEEKQIQVRAYACVRMCVHVRACPCVRDTQPHGHPPPPA